MHKVLVVEDDRFLSSAYRAKLSKNNFEVVLAANGEEALKELKSFKPDIILLDLVMPVMDGFSALEEIKNRPDLMEVPVIVTSNLGQKEDLDKALGLGAADYVVKSDLSLDDLIKKIEKLIKNKT